MRKIVVAAVISAALVSAASADTKTYYRSGAWENYGGTTSDGQPICGMSISKPDVSMALHVKWINGSVGVQAFKETWHIPEGTQVPIELGFDKNLWGRTIATGSAAGGREYRWGTVTFGIVDASVNNFLEEFAHADKLWLRFTNGNETPWVADMVGSRNSVNSFKMCIGEMIKRNGTTQPYSSSTQPYESRSNGSSTQPFDQTAPIVPKPVTPAPVPAKPGLKPYESKI